MIHKAKKQAKKPPRNMFTRALVDISIWGKKIN